jgi:hypothetical protein
MANRIAPRCPAFRVPLQFSVARGGTAFLGSVVEAHAGRLSGLSEGRVPTRRWPARPATQQVRGRQCCPKLVSNQRASTSSNYHQPQMAMPVQKSLAWPRQIRAPRTAANYTGTASDMVSPPKEARRNEWRPYRRRRTRRRQTVRRRNAKAKVGTAELPRPFWLPKRSGCSLQQLLP